jgi:hypothetical protein
LAKAGRLEVFFMELSTADLPTVWLAGSGRANWFLI